jgi:hypothetical protein
LLYTALEREALEQGDSVSWRTKPKSAPSAPQVSGAPIPQINTGGGQNPSSQIAQTIGAAQRPVKAYVVSQDVSSTQAFDRRTNSAATF